ncbi:hypothetical protein FPZ54_04545 [Sphingomonas suaedae]|uniref:Bacterial type II secretion system protein E domain-containing protein n=1 Tax=Sphingomonas suaedae TaxID=2599297 RepID=A0A518RD11_9SPHN|nr:hypothetical protein [Sphingomonas suaedae]QDX25365.1 hypothetical protein FPZ54_04545 [Sphingomonas suaedae]
MRDAASFEDLVRAATRSRATALHIVLYGDNATAFARFGSDLMAIRDAPVPPDWVAQAAAHPCAARRGDRIVIDLTGEADADCALSDLGMPRGMRARLRDAMRGAGGALLIASQDADATSRVMDALADAPGERYVARLAGGRADLDLAARMDCDSILIARCEDRATLDAAFELAQQGRRVVMGIDAENVVAAIGRLRSWRVNRYLLALALRALIAVRPEQRLCATCRNPTQACGSDAALLGVDPGTVIYRPAGCPACDYSGFDGTALLFETVAIDADLRRLLAEGGDAAILARHAFISTPTLAGSARLMAREGQISVDAAIGITREAGRAGISGSSPHPHLLPSPADAATQRLDGTGISPLSARLRGDRGAIG